MECSMIEDGRSYGLAMVLQHLLRKLEQRGVLSPTETTAMLDHVCNELAEQYKQQVLAPEASADAAKTVGMLYLPLQKP